jgi:subtilisin family serine protease
MRIVKLKPVIVSVLLAALFSTGLAQSQTGSSTDKIESKVLSDLRRERKVTFFVVLGEQADLSQAAAVTGWKDRGEAVVASLRETAGRTQSPLLDFLARFNAEVTPFWIVNTIRVTTSDEQLIHRLAALPNVALIKADKIWQLPEPAQGAEEPTVQSVEWGVSRVHAPDVWSQYNASGQGIVVASIDTGVQYNHPALVMQYRGRNPDGTFNHNYNWYDPARICGNPSLAPCDNNGHGTHTMGTAVGGDGGSNQIGVAPGAQWITAKGCENNTCTSSSLLSAGQWILAPTDLNGQNPRPDLRPNIVNNSWGGGSGSDPFYRATVQAWVNAGIFPTFAIGNSGSSCSTAEAPGTYPESFGAGATDIFDNIAAFSSRGPANGFGGIVKPNVSAPGVNVRSSVPTNNYASFSGTSMATPHASGVVALLWSANPALVGNIAATVDLLQRNADFRSSTQCGSAGPPNNVYGWGIVNALTAVENSLPTYTLTVASSNPTSGVSITVSPNDKNNQGSASTQFTRTYYSNTSVTLTASSTAGGNNFSSWSGCDSASGTTCNVTMSTDKTVTAVYVASSWTFCANENQFCSFTGTKLVRYGAGTSFNFQTATNGIACNNATFGDPIFGTVKHCDYMDVTASTHILTVASSNPSSGVSINVSPNDSNGQGNGATQFTRIYANNPAVTLTAPSAVAGNNFSAWSGCDSSSGTTCNVTMSADKTVTAVYVASSWTFCANENQFCSFTGTKLVRYGAGTSFNFQTATNGIACDNATFGDPIFGTVKRCDYMNNDLVSLR